MFFFKLYTIIIQLDPKCTDKENSKKATSISLPGTSKMKPITMNVEPDETAAATENKTKHVISAKQQLLYLSELLNFEVIFAIMIKPIKIVINVCAFH